MTLQPAEFHILLSLASENRHGYAIMQDVDARSGGAVRLSAGTLYRTIQRLLEKGWISEVKDRSGSAEDDERRRYYRITKTGLTAVRAETSRLSGLLHMARNCGFAPEKA